MRPMRRTLLQAAVGLCASLLGAQSWAAATLKPSKALPLVEVWKTPTCGCCGAWVDHMRASGFEVRVHDVPDTATKRREVGIPSTLGSCHTALVGGYALEGHVPAQEVKALLSSRRKAIGLAVPGMPVGSPGMEMGPRLDPYEVLLVLPNGRTETFARYPRQTS